jgi:hypothetical protein
MNREKQLQMAVRLLSAEIAAGRIKSTEEDHYHDEIRGRLLMLFGLIEDTARALGVDGESR